MGRLVSLQDLWDFNSGGNSLPSGIICLWHGLLADTPSGWAMKLA